MRHDPPPIVRIERPPTCKLDATWQNVEDRHPPSGVEVEAHTSDCRGLIAVWDRLDQCWYAGCIREDVVAWRSIGKPA